MKIKNTQRGFISVSVILAVFIASLLGTAGGYYALKEHSDSRTDNGKTTEESTEIKDATKEVDQLDSTPITRLMEQGAEGNDVCILQEILKAESVFEGDTTCYYGVKTHWAVEGLMQKYGYSHTPDKFGKVDVVTMDLLNELYVLNEENELVKKNGEEAVSISKPTQSQKSNVPKNTFTLEEIRVRNQTDRTTKETDRPKEDYEQRFKDFSREAKVLLATLETDKANFELLKTTVAEHRTKHIAHAKNLMSQWADVATEIAGSLSGADRDLLEGRRESIIADQNYLVADINSYYEIVNLYFIDPLRKKDFLSVITSDQEALQQCLDLNIEHWVDDKMFLDCELRLVMTQSVSSSYAEDFTKITEKLVEIDHIVFENIGKHTAQAEEDIMNAIEFLKRMSSIVETSRANLEAIARQAEQSSVSSIPNTQSVKCFTTTNDNIFSKDRTYNTRCEPYTQTFEEKCALQRARSVSTTGVYIGGMVDPACK